MAALEVFQDLMKKSHVVEYLTPDLLFTLAGCFYNGSITQRDPAQGLRYLRQAVEAGHHDALMCAPNLFRSCGDTLPQSLANAWLLRIEPSSTAFRFSRSIDYYRSKFPWRTYEGTVWQEMIADTWQRLDRNAYDHCLTSRDRLLEITQYPLGWQIGQRILADNEPFDKTFDYAQLSVFKQRGYRELSGLDKGQFCTDMMKSECVELSDKSTNFTILQRAICLGDEEMVRFLVQELSANCNNYGDTPGWTPLWLACTTGQFRTAQFLISNRANVHCEDENTGFTILHLLSRFSHASEHDWLLGQFSSEGNSSEYLDKPSKEGFTPLHAAFLVSVDSSDSTCRALLSHGADPTVRCEYGTDFMTPIAQCALRLNSALLQCVLDCPYLSRNQDSNTRICLAEAKEQAFRHLITKTNEFTMRAMAGSHWHTSLRSTLQLLVDQDMQRAFNKNAQMTDNQDVLRAALSVGRGAVARCLLDILHPNAAPGPSCINRAIERKQNEFVKECIARGAELAAIDPDTGRNALHASATYNPRILPLLVDRLAGSEEAARPRGVSKEVLEQRNREGFDVASILLVEGTDTERDLVDQLRHRFDLSLDELNVLFLEEDRQTLAAYIINCCVYGDFMPVSSLRYLLRIQPAPAFACTTRGDTLLTHAVSGRSACKATFASRCRKANKTRSAFSRLRRSRHMSNDTGGLSVNRKHREGPSSRSYPPSCVP